jgi:hypothetical protein
MSVLDRALQFMSADSVILGVEGGYRRYVSSLRYCFSCHQSFYCHRRPPPHP